MVSTEGPKLSPRQTHAPIESPRARPTQPRGPRSFRRRLGRVGCSAGCADFLPNACENVNRLRQRPVPKRTFTAETSLDASAWGARVCALWAARGGTPSYSIGDTRTSVTTSLPQSNGGGVNPTVPPPPRNIPSYKRNSYSRKTTAAAATASSNQSRVRSLTVSVPRQTAPAAAASSGQYSSVKIS